MSRTPRQAELHKRSGQVRSDNPFVSFLYILMRDHVPTGVVAKVVADDEGGPPYDFTNGWLAQYAAHVVAELTSRVRKVWHKNGTKCEDDGLPLGPCELPHLRRLTAAEQAEVLLALQGSGLHERMREHFLLDDLERGG